MAGSNYGYLFQGALEEDIAAVANCSWNDTNTDIMRAAIPVTIVSSALSIAGSILIIFTFVMWKDVRKSVARRILLFLAIADLLGALGYFCGEIFLYIWYGNGTICRIQSFWTTYFPVVSFFWTAYLAIYFVVALVLKKPNWTSKLMLPFHLTAWTIPLVICVVFVSMDYLGPNPVHNTNTSTIYWSQVAVGWCFVSSRIFENVTNETSSFQDKMAIYFLVEAVSGKMWEMLAYGVVIVCYCLIVCSNRCKWCKYDPSTQPQSPDTSLEGASSYYTRQRIAEAMASADYKLILVPIIFVFLRFWGTLRYFIFMFPECTQPCIDSESHNYWLQRENCLANYPALIILQAFCDPLQGFGNAVLFVFFSRVLLHRLWSCTCGVFQSLKYCITYPCTQCHQPTSQPHVDTDAIRSIQSKESTDLLRVTYSPALKRRQLNGDGGEGLDKENFSNSHQQLDYGSMKRSPLLNSKENGSLH